MGRVKFNVNTEYAYVNNFKILQSTPLAPSAIASRSGTDNVLSIYRCLCAPSDRPSGPCPVLDQVPYAGQPGVSAVDKKTLGPVLSWR